MLSNNLSTNEIKDSAGTEIEFTRLSTDGRTTVFAKFSENPAYPHRMRIAHQEIGTGTTKRRRSLIGFEYSKAGAVDTTTPQKAVCNVTLDIPIGNSTDNTAALMALANMISFLATTGAGTTILLDGTSNGAIVLVGGGL